MVGTVSHQQEEHDENTTTTTTTAGGMSSAASCPKCMPSLTLTHVLRPPSKSIVERNTKQQQHHEESTVLLQYTLESQAWECTFSRNGEWLAACFGAPDACVRVWRRKRRRIRRKASTTQPEDLSSDQQKQGCNTDITSDTSATFITVDDWVLHSTLDGIHKRTIRSISFAPINSPLILAAGSFDGSISIWENNNTKIIEDDQQVCDDDVAQTTQTIKDYSHDWDCTTQLEGHESEVKCVQWNTTGSLLATCGRDKTVWLWESFLPGTIGGPNECGDFECIAVLNGHEGDVKCVIFAPSHGQWGEGDEIVLSSAYDDSIKIWAEEDGDWYCAVSLDNIHTDTIWSLALAPGGLRVVSASADGSMAILKAYTATERKQILSEDDVDQNDGVFGSSSVNGLWKCVGKLPDAHYSSIVYSIHCAPARAGHGRIVSGGSDNRIQIYREVMDSTSDQPLFTLDTVVTTTHGDVNCVCWHPWDGSILCSAGDDGTVRLWKYKP